jgi:hypothetical protein
MRSKPLSSRRGLVTGLSAVLLAALAIPAAGQINQKKYAGYFLVGQFGEICTMCEAVVLCEAAQAPITATTVPADGSFTLYHLHTRTFWSQVSTIWEWFIANFNSELLAAGHERPVTLYTVENGAWTQPLAVQMRVALEPALLTISDGREIDRKTRRWRQTSGATDLGYCERLPLWEALAVIGTHTQGGNRHE